MGSSFLQLPIISGVPQGRILGLLLSTIHISKIISLLPYYIYLQLGIESIQRCFLKYVSFRFDGTYPERNINYIDLLDRHFFSSLCHRREIMKVALCGEWLIELLMLIVFGPINMKLLHIKPLLLFTFYVWFIKLYNCITSSLFVFIALFIILICSVYIGSGGRTPVNYSAAEPDPFDIRVLCVFSFLFSTFSFVFQ